MKRGSPARRNRRSYAARSSIRGNLNRAAGRRGKNPAMRGACIGLVAVALTLLWVPGASAELRTVTVRQGPIPVRPYAVRYTSKSTKFVRTPRVNGFLVGMHARVVDRRGMPPSLQRL